MTWAVGSLVRVRGREWVVLPESTNDFLVVRPLGGTDEETAGIAPSIEAVESATFSPPDPERAGDYRSGRVLRDAIRLGFRSSAGPFRSFGQIAVEPRPYQLVPLLMALRLDPVRILIADDVGVGKSVEAGLIARELLSRGEEERLAVLCPPHLAEQWQRELREKFHIDAELVLPGTVTRLEKHCGVGESLFDVHRYVIVSTDFIKSDRRREDFLRACPDLVIVDEAHTCASGFEGRGGRHQRHQLLKGLAIRPERHLVLVTATPHSGKEDAFRSLIALLNPDFATLPEDLSGEQNEPVRRNLARHFVQRRRGDIRVYLDAKTDFPERDDKEEHYRLDPEYGRLFEKVMSYAQELVQDEGDGSRQRQRVRWWSALALLRSLASSPRAAAATLRKRAEGLGVETADEADELGRRAVLDLLDDESAEGADVSPGADAAEEDGEDTRGRRRLRELAREAENLAGEKDQKLLVAVRQIRSLVDAGHRPIVFCRFIETAEYVAQALRERLPRGVEVAAVTGMLPPEDRERRVLEVASAARHVLVATDCLSEGVNLQEHFDSVFHYDLSWNPTRHEQREGRVDRYGQPRPTVHVVTYYGLDNYIDRVVLDVLVEKHRKIRNSLGISVPVPVDTDEVVEAIFESLLLRSSRGATSQLMLEGFEDHFKESRRELYGKWDRTADREKQSQTFFAQRAIKVDDVLTELREIQRAIGSGADVERFVRDAVVLSGGSLRGTDPVQIDLGETPRALREAVAYASGPILARFSLPVPQGHVYLSRTHPVVEGLATHVLDRALDGMSTESRVQRCGAIRTSQVTRRTTLLLCRGRFHVVTRRRGRENELLAEDSFLVAFTGSPETAERLSEQAAEELLSVVPDGNVLPDQARDALSTVVASLDRLASLLAHSARGRAESLLASHTRVREALRERNASCRVEPQLPVDVLGVYVYLPKPT